MFGIHESNRGAFLEATREAREERAAERRREEAAIKIQATVRGWLVRCAMDKKIREKFDLLFGNEPAHADQTTTLPLAMKVFAEVTRFIKIFKMEKDKKRFETFARYLITSMDSENVKLSYVSVGMNKEHTLQWIQHMKDVLHIACKLLETLQAEVSSENRLISLYLHLLLTFTATNTWRLLRLENFEPLRPALNKLTENLMGDLVARGLYTTLNHVLVKGLCRGRIALRGPAITTVITLSLRPLAAAQYSEKLLSLATIHIMSVPALVHHLVTVASEASQMLCHHGIFERVVEFVQTEQNLRIIFNTLEGSYALCLLANLVQLSFEERDAIFLKLAFPKFNFVVTRLLEKCGEYVTTKQSSLTQWHPVLGWFSRPLDQHINESLGLVKTQLQLLWSGPVIKIMFSTLTNMVRDQDAHIQESGGLTALPISPSSTSAAGSLGVLSSSSLIRKALERKLSASSMPGSVKGGGGMRGGGSRKLGSQDVSTVAMVCSMYHTAITTLSQLRMDILTGLCYKSDMVHHLWLVLQSLGPTCGLKSFLDLLSVSTKATAPEFHLLMLFCDATTHLVT
ncbi:Ubiquitin-protein ligase E3B, partial [Halocaridina rubra]